MPNQNSGGSGQLARKQQPRHDKSFQLLENFSSRDELAKLLGGSDDTRLLRFVSMLLSPQKGVQKRSLAKLADMCDLSYAELIRAISQSRVSEGILRMSARVPDVMESVAKNACNRESACQNCKGTGETIDRRASKRGHATVYRACYACDGSGKVITSGNIESQRMVFEAVGLTNRKSPLFNINMDRNRPGELPTVEMEMGSIGRVLDVKPQGPPKESE